MIGWAVVFFVLAIVAGVLGFSGVMNLALNIAIIFLLVGVVLVVVYAVTGRRVPPAA